MKNRVKILREGKNMTQNQLAEKSGLSLRTVQRIEAGSILKGFSLKTIAEALEVHPGDLMETPEEPADISRAKLINLSALLGLIIPYGGIIVPAVLTYKTKDSKNKELGKSIICIQIIIAVILSVAMIASPFIQKALSLKFPLFIVLLIFILCVKLYVIIRNGISLNIKSDLAIKLKTSFL
ncbi:XRE family transcriptional regulator [Elizabethkingia meningoseptica]|uniref:helix-turn-helix domain-containing protein n=1 Tax=Elizabethkingia meningoseptica TaxID=238 RepID=UPI000332BE20|nr:helix-turn-helix transcriptional regulator [Elizabethkingia meningoseptica]AQX05390.1 XRE family transcriptional regulator [Elizabethkingia meningoseptica]AQX47431.1 XRE family transcriptional regulator [Elizabethkingia meningoseptica]EOR29177.1 XRE family transcriptional regulator [Elizabethkingia meningoseptica ATCC 13253 = NBRC 12535]KUY24303.1 XRE family transcriptional regulator [Elizabethkingia meningoseptica]OPB67498.1 XRE family transcriptional regulator [Elizabethkingia meningosept